ncbi:hypothetical protein Hanom_Chr15g01395961 [Helianthus anomalus]
MIDANTFSQFETLSKTFLCWNLTTVGQLSLATLDLELHSKYVHMALEGQPTIVVDDLIVVDHFILNTQTRRVTPLFI